MARRKKSLFASMMPTPKRRSTKRSSAVFPLLSLPSPAAAPATKRAVSRTAAKRAKPSPGLLPRRSTVDRPGGTGTWTEHQHIGMAGARGYFVYVPKALRRTTKVPLLVMLHGCTQTPAEFAAATRFNQAADRQGFVVVYPHQTAAYNMNRCWNWFEPRHQTRGSGEPAIITAIVERLIGDRTRFRIDPTRVYAAGISAGAGMAITLGATYPDVYAAVGVHSGPPYHSASGVSNALGAMAGRTAMPDPAELPAAATGLPPTIVFQGTADFTVRAINETRVTEQWLALRAAATAPTDPDRVVRSRATQNLSGQRNSTVTRWYTARGRTCLESWLVGGLGHAWSGGLAKGSFSDPLGPRATTVMWRFLAAQQLAGPG